MAAWTGAISVQPARSELPAMTSVRLRALKRMCPSVAHSFLSVRRTLVVQQWYDPTESNTKATQRKVKKISKR